jgi:hypothetical protein
MYIAGCTQQQDPLNGALGGDKDKNNNIVIEGHPHGGLRGNDEAKRREYCIFIFDINLHDIHMNIIANQLLAVSIPF